MTDAGRIAHAQSLFQSGNIRAAEREVLGVLERNPDEPDALELLVNIAVREQNTARALRVVNNWVARHPNSTHAHMTRVRMLIETGKKRDARKALEIFRRDFPAERETYDALCVGYELKHGDPQKAEKQIKRLRKTYGDNPILDRFEMHARLRMGDLIGTGRSAGRVLKNDPQNASALFSKAVSAFRTCRFAKARKLARQVRALAPEGAPVCNELIVASYAAYFPPFLVSQFILMLIFFMGARLPIGAVLIFSYFLGPVIGVLVILIVHGLADDIGIPPPVFYWSMAGWAVYALFVFLKPSRLATRKSNVKLSADY